MEAFLRRSWAEVDLDAVAHNYRLLRDLLPAKTKIMAVLKANANNCGDIALSQLLETYREDWYGVSNLEEALTLREAGSKKPILILGYTPPELAGLLSRHGITQTILSPEYAQALSREAGAAGVRVEVQIKLDTGMSRIGLLCYEEYEREALEQCRRICADPALKVTGVFTHIATFYNLDEDSTEFSRLQYRRFMEFTRLAADEGLALGMRHCCNSPGAVNHPEMALDLVRSGTALFGALTDCHMERRAEFIPSLAVKSVVACVKTVKKGSYLGYGRGYRLPETARIVTLPIGYSDVCRMGEGPGSVLIGGVRHPVVGAACMDQIMVDASAPGKIALGDEAVLLGRQGEAEIGPAEFGAFLNTGPEEAYCCLTKRLPHVYLQGGRPVRRAEYTARFREMQC